MATPSHASRKLFYLATIWTQIRNSRQRTAIGTTLLAAFKSGVNDELLASEVLQRVGTPVCECNPVDAWHAVALFSSHRFSVSLNIAALRAGARLIKSGKAKKPDEIAKVVEVVEEAKRLSQLMNVETRAEAVRFLTLAAPILGL
ncbi:MAG: hypothetical protein P4L46_21435 [Fimbriimonas sp.]|nr:hypothetical protein [Fimbriimonas sp.]